MAQTKTRFVEEEIRFAVVLNGGVSLAVWMGGAVRELDRLTQGGGEQGTGPYSEFLRMVGSRARVDVIAGTSAGGINGAALALAQVNPKADLGSLRDLWAIEGRMESMLRQPFRGSPPSLLRGDEFFLPQLHLALQRLIKPFEPRAQSDQRPIDLTITTTLLTGSPYVTVDGLGQQLSQTAHEGRFNFKSEYEPPPDNGAAVARPGDFQPDQIAKTVKRLALASRCTAGFPIAFEPSFIPVGERQPADGPAADQDQRPDMRGFVSWEDEGSERDRSRFAVDGGVLVNTPTRAVLKAVREMPASGPVRRIVLLVYPHAGSDVQERADVREARPPLTKTLGKILGAQMGQGSRTYVEEVEQHNVLAAARRRSRLDLLRTLSEPTRTAASSPQALTETLELLAPHYRRLKIRRAARDLAQRVPRSNGWPYERIRAAAEAAQLAWHLAYGSLPYVPGRLPPGDVASIETPNSGWAWGVSTATRIGDAVLDLLRRLVWAVPVSEADYISGQRELLHLILRELRKWRRTVDDIWTTDDVLKQLEPNQDYWTLRLAAYHHATQPEDVPAGAVPAKLASVWAKVVSLLDGKPAVRLRTGEAIRRQVLAIADIALGAANVLRTLDLSAEAGPDPLELKDLKPWQALLCADPAPAEQGLSGRLLVLSRLLGLEVITSCLGEETETGAELAVELIQISLQTANAFAQHTITPDDKAAGMAINRFSGFLKQSWRVNDWTWGRVDAATMLCHTIFDPQRLRRVAVLDGRLTSPAQNKGVPAAVLDALRKRGSIYNFSEAQILTAAEHAAATVRTLMTTAFGPATDAGVGTDPVSAYLHIPTFDLRLQDLAIGAVDELIPVYDSRVSLYSLARTAKNLADLAAWGLHVQIASEELPALAKSVQADALDGANVRSRGALFLETNRELIAKTDAYALAGKPVPTWLGVKALQAFDQAGIGHEALGEEATSDQMIRTTVTAAGVAVTVLDGKQFGIAAARPITKVLRGAALLPYWAILGLTRASKIGQFLAVLGLAIGGVLAVLALFGGLPEWGAGPAAAIGAGALLSTFGYAALRSGTLVHGLVLLSPVIPLVAYAMRDTTGKAQSSAQQGVSVVVVIGLLVAGLAVLASLPAPVRGPVEVLKSAWRRLRELAPRLLLVVAATAAVVVVVALIGWLLTKFPHARETLERWLDALAQRKWWLIGLAAVAIIAGELRLLSTLRVWRLIQDPKDLQGPGSWKTQPIVHASGNAAQWCVVYGLTYLAIFLALLTFFRPGSQHWPAWYRTSLITCVGFAALLLLVAPWWLALRTRARIHQQLLDDATPKLYGPDAAVDPPAPADPGKRIECQLRKRLLARGQSYRFLLRKPVPGGDELQLTARGEGLASRITIKLRSGPQ